MEYEHSPTYTPSLSLSRSLVRLCGHRWLSSFRFNWHSYAEFIRGAVDASGLHQSRLLELTSVLQNEVGQNGMFSIVVDLFVRPSPLQLRESNQAWTTP